MATDLDQGLDLSQLALSLAAPACKAEDVAALLRERLVVTVPDIDDEICSAVLNWLAQATAMHAASASAISAAEMQEAGVVATALCGFRCGQAA